MAAEHVEGGSSSPLNLEYEAIGLEYLLYEPSCNKGVVDDVLGTRTTSLDQIGVSQVPRVVDCDGVDLGCMRRPDDTWEGEECREISFADGPFQETDEWLLHVNNVGSLCEDFLLDSECEDGASEADNVVIERTCSTRSGHQQHVLCIKEKDCPELSDLSATTFLASIYDEASFLLDTMKVQDLHECFKNAFGWETLVKDELWLKRQILSGTQSFVNMEDDLKLSSLSSSDELDRSSCSYFPAISSYDTEPEEMCWEGERPAICDSSSTLSCTRWGEKIFFPKKKKRSGRRARHYWHCIEELVNRPVEYHKTRPGSSPDILMGGVDHTKSQEMPSGFEGKPLSQRKLPRISSGIGLVTQQQCHNEDTQVLSIHPLQRCRSKEYISSPGHDSEVCEDNTLLASNENSNMETSLVNSQDDTLEDGCKMKRQNKYWSTAEVKMLIEGVSEHGLGKWTDIKRLYFADSSCRTSVHLKDKWRNLVKASCQHRQGRRKDQYKGRVSGFHNMSRPVKQQIQELVKLHQGQVHRSKNRATTCTAQSGDESAQC